MSTLVWLRQDLRLDDNPAMLAACQRGEPIIPIYIDDAPWQASQSAFATFASEPIGAAPPGAASRVWLHHALNRLQRTLRRQGADLFVATGDPATILEQAIGEHGATALYWNRCYDPWRIARDGAIKKRLATRVEVKSFNASLLVEPWELLKQDGTPYRVFTPFWNQLAKRLDSVHRVAPARPQGPRSAQTPAALALLPDRPWAESMMQHWETHAQAESQFETFISHTLAEYPETRDLPAIAGTSGLSAYLHFGEIGPRQLLQRLLQAKPLHRAADATLSWIRQLAWREFAHYCLYHQPSLQWQPVDTRFASQTHAPDDELLELWRRGQSGMPLVDAGMRELWATGYMHNRVRMVCASWLVKQMQQPWQAGEAWFRDTLVDADIANNAMGWQWCAGTGIDAAPYFRVFNPVRQGERFDPAGEYVRRWLPELADVPTKHIHQPWMMDDAQRRLIDYPEPAVSVSAGRVAALDYWKSITG